MITASGVKPTVSVKWERGNFWIYGAIEPLTGKHFQQEYPKLNGDYFQQFLDWLSQQLGSYQFYVKLHRIEPEESGGFYGSEIAAD
ncbi:MAG TPA: hypothetical protein VIQ31_20805, partial [Phormidium sp.]